MKPERGREATAVARTTNPPRLFNDASLMAAMCGVAKFVSDPAIKKILSETDGIGTPATRASIIERLIDVGYIERDGRALVATEKGLNVIRLLDGHPLTSPSLTGDWERRLGQIERGEDSRKRFMGDIAGFATETVNELDAKLNMSIAELNLSVRASNCLESENIMTVRELVQRSEDQMLEVRNFGETTLSEVQHRLRDMGLHLGMRLPSLASV